MSNQDLLYAIGTLHCPHCHLPLFASPLVPEQPDAPALAAATGRFVTPFVYLADDAFPDATGLVEAAEQAALWCPAAVVGEAGSGYGESRRNEFLPLTSQAHPTLAPWEAAVREVLHAGARAYAAAVDHLQLRSDLGLQVLRYHPGQEFREHVDVLPGPTVYGQRLLTAILYLNDDFEGGELTLPQQGLIYKPRAGSLLLFPSGFCFPHSSRPVVHGVKYSCVTWFI